MERRRKDAGGILDLPCGLRRPRFQSPARVKLSNMHQWKCRTTGGRFNKVVLSPRNHIDGICRNVLLADVALNMVRLQYVVHLCIGMDYEMVAWPRERNTMDLF